MTSLVKTCTIIDEDDVGPEKMVKKDVCFINMKRLSCTKKNNITTINTTLLLPLLPSSPPCTTLTEGGELHRPCWTTSMPTTTLTRTRRSSALRRRRGVTLFVPCFYGNVLVPLVLDNREDNGRRSEMNDDYEKLANKISLASQPMTASPTPTVGDGSNSDGRLSSQERSHVQRASSHPQKKKKNKKQDKKEKKEEEKKKPPKKESGMFDMLCRSLAARLLCIFVFVILSVTLSLSVSYIYTFCFCLKSKTFTSILLYKS
jgi:hypothetical protein